MPLHIKNSSSRGAVLMAAVAILAIMTILVLGLAATQDYAYQGYLVSKEKIGARRAAQNGLNAAIAQMTAAQPTAPLERDIPLANGKCRISLRPTVASDAPYAGNFIRPRIGDCLLTIDSADAGKTRAVQMQQVWLVNTQTPRRVRLTETMKASAVETTSTATAKGK
jgi:hypothetical protein